MPRGIPNTPESNASEAAATKAPAKLKQYRITFHGEGGDIEIGHNYKLNLYKRNVETTIDENYLNVLKHSVVTTQIQDSDGKWKAVSIPTYQYSVEPI
jgi:hypothetical protein